MPPRSDYCIRGHLKAGDNLYVAPRSGQRMCRACSEVHRATRAPKRRKGPPLILRMTLYERWIRFVDQSGGPDACWPWTGLFNKQRNRPMLTYQRRPRYAHRIALELTLGRPIRDGMFACHTCDNPPCVNPLHLYEGTPADNMRDAKERGRLYRGPVSAEARANMSAAQRRRFGRTA